MNYYKIKGVRQSQRKNKMIMRTYRANQKQDELALSSKREEQEGTKEIIQVKSTIKIKKTVQKM